jgi:hypothetical protein
MNLQDIGLGGVAQNFATKKPRGSGAFFNILTQIRLAVFEHAASVHCISAQLFFDTKQLVVLSHTV